MDSGKSRTLAIEELKSLVGPGAWTTNAFDLEPHVVGPRREHGQCAILLRPAHTEEVAAIVRLCACNGIPLVPQGGNTGLSDAAVPKSRDAAILNLSRMNRLRSIDPLDCAMTVEAGMILGHVQSIADEHGLLFPLSLGAEGTCQIGGNLATNAGGKNVLRYGMARDLVLGLEVVLADGSIWDGLSKLRKDNSGYDLKHLFLGSEGTLGIITAATLKLFPRPGDRLTAVIAVRDPDAAVELLARSRRASVDGISAFEIMNKFVFQIALDHLNGARNPFGSVPDWCVFLDLSANTLGDTPTVLLEELLQSAVEDGLISDAVIAQSEDQARALWRLRDDGVMLQWKEGASILHDASVPISRVPDFISSATAAVHRLVPGSRIAIFGHIGDGNIHFQVSQPVGAEKAKFRSFAPAIHELVYKIAVDAGGSFSAEHGIGRIKTHDLLRYKSSQSIALMKKLKFALDPKGLFNPGVIFTEDS